MQVECRVVRTVADPYVAAYSESFHARLSLAETASPFGFEEFLIERHLQRREVAEQILQQEAEMKRC